jgi:hypothetical protein
MRTLAIRGFLTQLRKNFKGDDALLGRWNLKDNEDIKATLANMDSCGDALCGTPKEYKNSINTILNKKNT